MDVDDPNILKTRTYKPYTSIHPSITSIDKRHYNLPRYSNQHPVGIKKEIEEILQQLSQASDQAWTTHDTHSLVMANT